MQQARDSHSNVNGRGGEHMRQFPPLLRGNSQSIVKLKQRP